MGKGPETAWPERSGGLRVAAPMSSLAQQWRQTEDVPQDRGLGAVIREAATLVDIVRALQV